MYNGARELDHGSTVQVHSTGTKCSSTCGHVAGSTVATICSCSFIINDKVFRNDL